MLGLERIGQMMAARKAKAAETARVAAQRKEIAGELKLDQARLGISAQDAPTRADGSRGGRQMVRTRVARSEVSPLVIAATYGYSEGFQTGTEEGKKSADERHTRETQIAKDAQAALIAQMQAARADQVSQFKQTADLVGQIRATADQQPTRIVVESDAHNGRRQR